MSPALSTTLLCFEDSCVPDSFECSCLLVSCEDPGKGILCKVRPFKSGSLPDFLSLSTELVLLSLFKPFGLFDGLDLGLGDLSDELKFY